MKYWIMPYAFGLDKDGTPDAEARARMDKALAIVSDKSYLDAPSIFLGAGMQECAQSRGAISLSDSGVKYLEMRGLSKHRIGVDARGWNTVTETYALYGYFKDVERNVIIEAATSWWHVPRVWAVCRIIFGRPIKVHATRSAHSSFRLLYDIMREVIAFPRSALMAASIRKKKNEQGDSGLDSAFRYIKKMAHRL